MSLSPPNNFLISGSGALSALDWQMEAVADARFSENVSWIVRFWFDLLSELIDDDVQILDFVAVVRAPHRLKDVAVRDSHAGVRDQVLKDLEFFEPQGYIASVDGGMVSSEIDLDPIKGDDTRAFLRCERNAP